MTAYLITMAILCLLDAGIQMAKGCGWEPERPSETTSTISALINVGLGIWALNLLSKVSP